MSYTNIIISKLTSEQKDAVITDLLAELDERDTELRRVRNEPVDTDKATSDAFDCLAVTQVNVWPFKESPDCQSHVKALASVVLNDQLQVRGLKVMDGENGLFVSYPLDPFFKGDGFKSLVFPTTRVLREHIENCVLEKYQYELDK